MRDFTDDLKDVSRRLSEAKVYLKIEAQRDRFRELEIEVSKPGLWDDQEFAKKLNAEYANTKGDIDIFDGLARQLEDAEVLHELAREIDDASQEAEIESSIKVIAQSLNGLASCTSIPKTVESTPKIGANFCCVCISVGLSVVDSSLKLTIFRRVLKQELCQLNSR
jgi:hypothetical protein